MQTNRPSFIHATGLLVGALLFLPNLRAADQTTNTDADAFPIFDNYVILGGQNAWVDKDKDAFQTRTDTAKGASAGIEDFNYEKDFPKNVTATIDGHAIGGNEDYLGHFNITKTDVGSVDAGYSRFRTYYDGVGGFFPTNNAWMPEPNQDLYVDRSKFWIEGTVNLPNKPIFTVRYTNELRDGQKDTTIWGPTDLTGITDYSTGVPVTKRAILPSYIDLGERHQNIEALMKHTIGKTTFELSVNEDIVNNLDTRYLNNYPGEVKLFKAPPANPLKVIPSLNVNNGATGYDEEGIQSNTFSAIGKMETVFNDKISFHADMRFQHLTSDFTGNRILYTNVPTPSGAVLIEPADNVLGLVGGSKVLAYTATTGVDLKPFKDFRLSLDLKGENRYTKGADSYTSIGLPTVSAKGVVTPAAPAFNLASETVNDPSWTPEINARYNGFRNVALYSTADFRYVGGTERVVAQYNTTTTPATQDEDTHENHGSYAIGANWVPCAFCSLRSEIFYKDHQNNFQDYANFPSAVPIQYVLGYQFYGVKLTAVVTPIPTVTLTTRYIAQTGTMETGTNIVSAAVIPGTYDSMNSHNQQIDETIDWTPIKQFYLEASANIVFDTTSTAYPQVGLPSGFGFSGSLVQNADNNYFEGSLLAGYVIDKKTDGEAQITYYRADNYDPALAAATVPYGAGQKDCRFTVGAKRKITNKLTISAKVGYLISRNDTSGDLTNYNAVVAYVALDQAF